MAYVARSVAVDVEPQSAIIDAPVPAAPPPAEAMSPPGAAATEDAGPSPAAPLKVADLDAQRFKLHPSVAQWQDFASPMNSMFSNDGTGGSLTASAQQLVQQVLTTGLLGGPQSAAYWTYHTARMSFFISQDLENIQSGAYPMPWDMAPAHRQNNPLFMLRRTAQFMGESVATLKRRVRETPDKLWLSSKLYPRYYTNTYHYQTDGWFSDWSASVYEHSTETLFFGRQDAMQRTGLLPIADFVREAEAQGRPASSLRLLEVAAGTGRFHTFIKDAYPDLPSVVSDLSPFYLARARSNLRYWRSLRQPSRQLGGVDDTGTEFLQTAAEAIAAPDESFDIVMCVYLFHELPEPVRRAAVSEFFRVLRPGGLAVLTDSVQLGDRRAWDNTIGLFGNFNEPYYRNYVGCDLGAMFQAAGFECDTKYVCSATKTLSFRKPAGAEPPQ
ncbi:hypothetical protein GPECTOR_41g677 [Gonium pectorale]|uniref:Methyltransferase domain-containing protein n=1 Tax=Gonium pectorale TaxID=33097 RepID=A0A150GAB7_GONPE|nr:hypothetical protein GPECTOR_41g677 [Gonium pectorale]|eukprot:KXZ46713.1 hypothetical protein GPECTOR_41g677 [Gonium pectorale]